MKQKDRTVNFNMGYADLSAICRQKTNTIMRDIAEFERFNIFAEQVQEFRSLAIDFDNTPTDQEFLGVVTASTLSKDELANSVRGKIKELSIFIKQYFGIKSNVYQSLQIKDLSRLNDLSLYRLANSVVRLAKTIDNSSAVAIASIVAETETNNTLFDKAIEEKAILIEERNIATHYRVIFANKLYEQLMDYCEIGRLIWIETHEAKYNDYVIY